jgi:hypothetical protein
MKFAPATCPDCGSDPQGIIETLQGLALLGEPDADGIDYAGETEVWWDSQVAITDALGLVTLSDGVHEWQAVRS